MTTEGVFAEFPCAVDPADCVRVMVDDEDDADAAGRVRVEVLCEDGCTVRLSDEHARALALAILQHLPDPT